MIGVHCGFSVQKNGFASTTMGITQDEADLEPRLQRKHVSQQDEMVFTEVYQIESDFAAKVASQVRQNDRGSRFPAACPNEMSQEPHPPQSDNITIFETEDGRTRVEVRFDHENVWLTQKLMADLYECSPDNISLHLKNIFADKELDPAATTEESSVVQKEGKREVVRPVTFYSLEAIIAVGYRVQSPRATQFRTWATNRLKDYLRAAELKSLNHIVDIYLDYAELQASRGRLMKMRDWTDKLDAFPQFNEQEILQDKGKVSHASLSP